MATWSVRTAALCLWLALGRADAVPTTERSELTFFLASSVTWSRAHQECQSRDMQLLVIPDDVTQTAVTDYLNYLNHNGDVWIGIYVTTESDERRYVTADGANHTFTPGAVQPVDQETAGQCVSLLRESGWAWGIQSCSQSLAFLCQKPTGHCSFDDFLFSSYTLYPYDYYAMMTDADACTSWCFSQAVHTSPEAQCVAVSFSQLNGQCRLLFGTHLLLPWHSIHVYGNSWSTVYIKSCLTFAEDSAVINDTPGSDVSHTPEVSDSPAAPSVDSASLLQTGDTTPTKIPSFVPFSSSRAESSIATSSLPSSAQAATALSPASAPPASSKSIWPGSTDLTVEASVLSVHMTFSDDTAAVTSSNMAEVPTASQYQIMPQTTAEDLPGFSSVQSPFSEQPTAGFESSTATWSSGASRRCSCACSPKATSDLTQELSLSRGDLSSTRRKLTSAPDARAWSRAAGCVAGVILGTMCGLLLLIDASKLVAFLASCRSPPGV